MTTRKFLTSVADVYGYDESDNLMFIGKTLLDSSIDTSLSNTDVRAGRGAQLQYTYYHSADMNITVSEAQWNLDFLANAVGSSVTTGVNVYTEETVTLTGGGAGTIVGTPLAASGTTIYGWVTLEDGTVEKVTFTGSAFTAAGGSVNDVVCVRYYALNSAARSLTINANIVPSIVRLVMETQLNSSDVSTNVIGKVQIVIPKATLTGKFTISMTADGVASTPLAARALAFFPTTATGCANSPYYATITEILTTANWYDDVIALSIVGGDISLVDTPTTRQLSVRAIPSTGAAFTPPAADISWASSVTATATVSSTGLVTTVDANGGVPTIVKASITAKNTIDANIAVTVTAP